MNQEAALILAGAGARGAFEAGAIQVLIENGIQFRSIVGTSAGALNGVALAYGVRAHEEDKMVKQMVEFWETRSTWYNGLRPSLEGIFFGNGFFNPKRMTDVIS